MLHNLCSVADHVLPFVPDEQTIKATTQFLTASKKEWDEEWKAWFVSLDPLKASASQAIQTPRQAQTSENAAPELRRSATPAAAPRAQSNDREGRATPG